MTPTSSPLARNNNPITGRPQLANITKNLLPTSFSDNVTTMGSGGRNKIPPALHVVRGTARRRRHPPVTPALAALTGPVTPPAWLTGDALQVWHAKVETYRRRNQGVRGFEGALAVYCQVEATLIRKWTTGAPVRVAEIHAFRLLATEFFDTPRSLPVTAPPTPTQNRVLHNANARDPVPGA
jgi:hypothetical protein